MKSIYFLLSRQVLLKFVLVGDAETGKTCIVNKFMSNKFNDKYIPTTSNTLYQYNSNCGSPTQQIIIDDATTNKKYIIQLQLWDTKGKLPENINISNVDDIPSFLKSIKHPKSKHNKGYKLRFETCNFCCKLIFYIIWSYDI